MQMTELIHVWVNTKCQILAEDENKAHLLNLYSPLEKKMNEKTRHKLRVNLQDNKTHLNHLALKFKISRPIVYSFIKNIYTHTE